MSLVGTGFPQAQGSAQPLGVSPGGGCQYPESPCHAVPFSQDLIITESGDLCTPVSARHLYLGLDQPGRSPGQRPLNRLSWADGDIGSLRSEGWSYRFPPSTSTRTGAASAHCCPTTDAWTPASALGTIPHCWVKIRRRLSWQQPVPVLLQITFQPPHLVDVVLQTSFLPGPEHDSDVMLLS